MIEAALLDDARLDPVQRELLSLTDRLLQAIHMGDSATYTSLCTPELSCFEDVCPYRIDGVAFHAHLVKHTARQSSGSSARSDILSPRVQVYGDAGIVTYTRLVSTEDGGEVRFATFNETRVFARIDGAWKLVHFHRTKTE